VTEPARDRSAGPDEPEGELVLGRDEALALLRDGELEVIGRLVAASNVTLVGRISLDEADGERRLEATCIYKPIRGEAPLWDFPEGTLAYREVAAHVVSEASGWSIVPPTVMRDGPFGRGMVQLWMDVDEGVDVVELIRTADPVLRPMAIFDAVVNNGDRKAGHLLPLPGGHVHGVDHGVCFSIDPKLRTVLWGWMGKKLRSPELDVLRRLRQEFDGALGVALGRLLAADEVALTAGRIDDLLASGRFPRPRPDWPAVPWPWY
jgi:uncharacterized repeat protein (TIGR03843 family)